MSDKKKNKEEQDGNRNGSRLLNFQKIGLTQKLILV